MRLGPEYVANSDLSSRLWVPWVTSDSVRSDVKHFGQNTTFASKLAFITIPKQTKHVNIACQLKLTYQHWDYWLGE